MLYEGAEEDREGDRGWQPPMECYEGGWNIAVPWRRGRP
jgi:hypothetical protein